MPRQPRRDAARVVHPVWARGSDGRAIFRAETHLPARLGIGPSAVTQAVRRSA